MATMIPAQKAGLGTKKSEFTPTQKQSFNTSSDMFGSEQGKNLSKAAKGITDFQDGVLDVEDQFGKTNDLTNTLELENRIKDWEFNNVTGEKGFNQNKLSQAKGNSAKFEEKWKVDSAEIMKDLEYYDAAEKLKAESFMRNRGLSMRAAVSQHETQQTDAHVIGQLKGRVDGFVDNGSMNFRDDNKMMMDITGIEASNKESFTRQGLTTHKSKPGEPLSDLELQNQKDVSAYYHKAIRGALATKQTSDLKTARELHSQALRDGDVRGEESIALAKEVASATITASAQEHAGATFTRFYNEETGEMDTTGAQKELREKLEGDEETKAVKFYLDMVAEHYSTADLERKLKGQNLKEIDDVRKAKIIQNDKDAPKISNKIYKKYKDDVSAGRDHIYETYADNKDLRDKLLKDLDDRTGHAGDTADEEQKRVDRADKNRRIRLSQDKETNTKLAQKVGVDTAKKYKADPSKGFDDIAKKYAGDGFMYDEAVKQYKTALLGEGMSEAKYEELRKEAESKKSAARRDRADIAKDQGPDVAAEAMVPGASESEDLKRIRKGISAELRTEAERIITNKHAAARRDRAEKIKQQKDEVWKVVKSGASYRDLSPEQTSALDGNSLLAMQRFETQRAIRGTGYNVVDDPATDIALHQMWMSNKEEFASMDLSQFQPDLTEGGFKYWMSQQRSIDKAAEKDAKKTHSYTLGDRLTKEYLNSAGIDYGSSATSSHAKKSQKAFSMIRSLIDAGYEDGKPPTRDDLDKGLAELFVKGEMDGTGFFSNDPDGHKFEMEGKTEGVWTIRDAEEQSAMISKASGVPENYILDIATVLEKAGKPVTLEAITDRYNVAIQRSNKNGRK